MAWKEIALTYGNSHLFQKHLLWLSANANIYFAMKNLESDDWVYYAGTAGHALDTGLTLTEYATEANAQTNYLTTTKDANDKVIAMLPEIVEARHISLFVESGSSITIYEWVPSQYFSAHEIVTGELLVTDQLSQAPKIKVEASSQERVLIGDLGSSDYGIRCRDGSGNILFEVSTDQTVLQSGNFGGSSGIKMDLANALITVNEAEGITIASAGGLKLTGDGTTPGALKVVGTSYTTQLGSNADGSQCVLRPDTDNTVSLYLGTDALGGWFDKKFSNIYGYSQNNILFKSTAAAGRYALLEANANANEIDLAQYYDFNTYVRIYGQADDAITQNVLTFLVKNGANTASITIDHDNDKIKFGTPTSAGVFEFVNGFSYLIKALYTDSSSESVADDAEITLPTGTIAGWGFVQAGNNEEYALFAFNSVGAVTLIANSTNVVNTDTDTNLCIYDAGTGVAIKNRLGSTKKIRYVIHYSDNTV